MIVLVTMTRTTHAIAHTLEAPLDHIAEDSPLLFSDDSPVLVPALVLDAPILVLDAPILVLHALVLVLHAPVLVLDDPARVLWIPHKLVSVVAPSRFLITSAEKSLCPATV